MQLVTGVSRDIRVLDIGFYAEPPPGAEEVTDAAQVEEFAAHMESEIAKLVRYLATGQGWNVKLAEFGFEPPTRAEAERWLTDLKAHRREPGRARLFKVPVT